MQLQVYPTVATIEPIFKNYKNIMKSKNKVRFFLLPIIVIIIAFGNYTRLTGTENIRAIHIVTLITLGMGIGILLQNIFAYFKRKGGDPDTTV